jgi:hypothetical protein
MDPPIILAYSRRSGGMAAALQPGKAKWITGQLPSVEFAEAPVPK